MSPTRELAQQIDQAMQGFSYYMPDVSSVAVYGGNDGNRYDQEQKGMRMGADVIIATPGRLKSHITMGNIDLSRVSFFVLDEADRMLDMGFSDDIISIAKLLPEDCQTIMFSATMPPKIEELARTLLKNPVTVKLAVSKPADKIQQSAYVCHETQKMAILKHLFKGERLSRVIIFSSSKLKVKDITRDMKRMGVNCDEMHSDLSQQQRDDVMYRFKSNQIDVLVATDIVARGIDIDDIATVINYDVPHDAEDYVHRIGRTARADRDGVAITLVRGWEIVDFMEIERFLGYEVTKNPLPEGIGEGPEYVPMIKKGRRGGKPNHKHQRGAKGKGGNPRKGRYRGSKKGKNERNAPKGSSK
jgi:superfamily II DNA/RNA helicase